MNITVIQCVIILLIYFAINFSLSFIEMNILENSSSPNNVCYQIHSNILLCSIINFIIGIGFGLYSLYILPNLIMMEYQQRIKKIKIITLEYSVINFLKNIWTVIIYFNLTEFCVNFYESNYYQLLILFYTEFIFAIICVMVITVIFAHTLYYFLMHVYKRLN